MAYPKNDIQDVEEYLTDFLNSKAASLKQVVPNNGMWAIRMENGEIIGGDRYTVLRMKPITKDVIMQIEVE